MRTLTASQFEISSDIVADARRALWLKRERVLTVADLHLGYAWAHRANGQLMPIPPANDTLPRLRELQRDYDPTEIIVVGDIVHRPVPVEALAEELRELVNEFTNKVRVTFVTGNHDRNLEKMLRAWQLPIELTASRQIADYLFAHGDSVGEEAGIRESRIAKKKRRMIMGHEHPAISIGDGVTTSQRCPCFLVSDNVIVLPAFSSWAAGSDIRAYDFMSETAQRAKFTRAIAICGGKLLPIAL